MCEPVTLATLATAATSIGAYGAGATVAGVAGATATTAGLTGAEARAVLPRYRDIVVPYAMAVDVLQDSSIPRYRAAARRAYGRHFDSAPPEVQCALIVETYNRGESMAGPRRIERREIRDVCLPERDWVCVAEQLEASCRVWATDEINGPGLCNRRRAEASVIRASATVKEGAKS
jgi:GH24 family phage-related lysozyme (muramidase)